MIEHDSSLSENVELEKLTIIVIERGVWFRLGVFS